VIIANPSTVSRDVTPLARFGPVIECASSSRPLYFRSGDREIVGIGEHARWAASGPNRFAELGERLSEALLTVQPAYRPYIHAIGSGSFDPAGEAFLIVPRVTIVRRGRDVTTIRIGDDSPSADVPHRSVGSAPVVEWPHIDSIYRNRVQSALGRLDAGFGKVVVARAITGHVVTPGDERAPLIKLADEYPDCHIFAVDGLWGASPETLVGVRDRRVHTRVLAGSAARGIDPITDAAAAAGLADSAKDRDEHEFAMQSVLTALAPHCRSIVGASTPSTLKLSNVWHLASDIEGVLTSRESVLSIIDSLHPTAAVAGVPTDRALATIADIEAIPRDRYAGPVGWVDGSGNGEWAIALRCAQWHDSEIIAHAGAGIIASSDPESEYAETELKFRPIRDALSL
jgi:menaquinone-specific isochorismate synthase